MQQDIPRLTQTKTGVYGYRRKIKQEHRHLFENKREIVKSFKTKDLRHAMRLRREMDAWFDKVLASNGVGLKLDPKLAPREKVIEVVKDLYNRNLHPSDLPSLSAVDSLPALGRFLDEVETLNDISNAHQAGKLSDEEYAKLFDAEGKKGNQLHKLFDYQARVELLRTKLEEKYNDTLEWESDIKKKVWDNNDPDVIRYKIMTGEMDVTPDPTWSNAMYSYLKENLKKTRNDALKKKHEKAAISLCQRLSVVLPKGMETQLKDLDISVLRNFMDDTWSNGSTRQRNIRVYQAVINNWNNLNPDQTVTNHFKAIAKANEPFAEQDSKERRSFTPEEHEIFLTNLLACTDPEIKLIGLIMLIYGAPNEEAAGLERNDVKLQSDTPYLLIRKNKSRLLGKKRLERAVPIVEPLLTHLKEYIENHYNGTDLLFPRYGVGDHASSERTKKLSAMVVNKRPDDDEPLSPYCLRHTFADKYKAARVSQDIAEYVMGHRSKDSNKIHARYGTGRDVDQLVEDMTAISNVKTWGFFEEFDTPKSTKPYQMVSGWMGKKVDTGGGD